MEERPLYRDPNLWVIFGVTLMAVLGVSSVTPAFPRIARELGIMPQQVGQLVTAFTLPGVFLAPVMGVLADRWGRKRVLVPSLLLFGLAGGACALARDFRLLVGLRFLQGMGASALGVLNVTLIGDLYSGPRRAEAMGYNASVLSIGTAAYPAVGGALATLGWFYPFALPLLALPVGLLVVWQLRNPEPRNGLALGEYLRRTWGSVRDWQAISLFGATFLTFVVLYGAYLTYLPFLVADAFGATSFVIGVLMSGMSLTTALASSQLGRLVKVLRPPVLVGVAGSLYALSLIGIRLAPTLGWLVLPAMAFGVAQGLNIPTLQTLLAGLAPLEQRAAFLSLNGMVLRLGQTVGPMLMGWAFGLGGVDAVLYTGAGLALLLVGVPVRMRRGATG